MTDQSDFADHVLSLGINNIGDSYALAFTATYICGGKTFQILVVGDPPPGYDTQSTEVEWTEQLLDLSMHDGTDVAQFMAQDIFLQKLAQDIMRIALPKMLELAPPAPGSPPPRDPRRGVHTVYEHLCPDMVKLQLVSRDGCFELIEGHHTQLPADDLKPITHSELEKFGVKDTKLLPTHAASEVVLLSQCKAGMSAYYATNLGRTEEWVCKLAYRWCQEATLRELETLAKIQTSRLRPGPELRVSTLKALVTHKDKVVGLLIDKIPTQYSSLEDVVRGSLKVPLSLRRKWAAQIEDTVKELHCLGIIWGDAKPGNIVIDECDDAWLIDFGGGFTQPWVDSELAESVEGDLQAVGRIRERLEED